MFHNLPFPTLFVCFLIFIAWLHYEKRKSSRLEEKKSAEFWQREDAANRSRNKDISDLPMFKPDPAKIPTPESNDENVCYYQNLLQKQMQVPMMDLSEYTNSDLKLAYGVGNFKTLSEFDTNFNDLLKNLSNLAKAYRKAGLTKEAIAVYRYYLDCSVPTTTIYRALGQIYAENGATSELRALADEVRNSDLSNREKLSEELLQLM